MRSLSIVGLALALQGAAADDAELETAELTAAMPSTAGFFFSETFEVRPSHDHMFPPAMAR